jgi:hypothetical protein
MQREHYIYLIKYKKLKIIKIKKNKINQNGKKNPPWSQLGEGENCGSGYSVRLALADRVDLCSADVPDAIAHMDPSPLGPAARHVRARGVGV